MAGTAPDSPATRRDLKATVRALVAPRRMTGARATFSQVLVPDKPVPEPFTDWISFPGNGSDPYAVFTPAQRKGLWNWTPASVVVRHEDTVEVAEARGQEIKTKRFPIAEIDRVTFGKVLLRAWFGFEGESTNGTDAVRIEFNNVTSRLFMPLIDAIRPTPPEGPGDPSVAEAAAEELGLKFVNYAEMALRDGDIVEFAIAQPEIVDDANRRSRRRHPAATAHLLLLTADEVILIGDDEESARSTRTRHGGAWTYVRRASVERTLLEERSDGNADVELQLKCGDRVRATFAATRRAALDDLIGRL